MSGRMSGQSEIGDAAILSIRGVSRSFAAAQGSGATLALEATSLSAAENDFITILGPSGCGKSTLLRIVAGLDHPTSGEVLLDGKRVTGPGADRGMVFQSYTLFPWLNVRDNVLDLDHYDYRVTAAGDAPPAWRSTRARTVTLQMPDSGGTAEVRGVNLRGVPGPVSTIPIDRR